MMHQGAASADTTGIVHVVDDDPSLGRAISSLLRSVGLNVATYTSTQAFLDAERRTEPACLLLDVRLPGMSGLDFQMQLQALGIRMPVIVMTGHADVPMSVRAMKAGASDFLTKPFRDQDLIDTVTSALEEDRNRRVQEHEIGLLRSRHATLTERERQVMDLVTEGRLNKQAAFELSLSEITVKIHRASAMRKMGARTLADLVKIAERLKGG
jgi:FixJ family two-component response regulator